MKIPPSAVPVLIAVGLGFGAGWMCKPTPVTPPAEKGETSSPTYQTRAKSASMAGGSASTTSLTSSILSGGTIELRYAEELKSLIRLPDKEFANRMVDAWLEREDPENLLSRALFADACDSGKAKAFYEEFKRRKGLSSQAECSDVRDFLTMSGKRYGPELVQQLLASNPGGVRELDSLVHDWISVEPTQAVDWLNSLPEDCPFYSRCLKGIVWGIGEMSPSSAAATFLKLPLEERNKKFDSLTGGVLKGHGFAGLTELANHFPDPADRASLLMGSLTYAMEKPPADFINGMAGHLSSVPDLTGPFETMAGRWAKSSPHDAIAWLEKNADRTDQSSALSLMAGQLSRAGQGDAVDAWLAAHPQSPGLAAVEAGRQSGRK